MVLPRQPLKQDMGLRTLLPKQAMVRQKQHHYRASSSGSSFEFGSTNKWPQLSTRRPTRQPDVPTLPPSNNYGPHPRQNQQPPPRPRPTRQPAVPFTLPNSVKPRITTEQPPPRPR